MVHIVSQGPMLIRTDSKIFRCPWPIRNLEIVFWTFWQTCWIDVSWICANEVSWMQILSSNNSFPFPFNVTYLDGRIILSSFPFLKYLVILRMHNFHVAIQIRIKFIPAIVNVFPSWYSSLSYQCSIFLVKNFHLLFLLIFHSISWVDWLGCPWEATQIDLNTLNQRQISVDKRHFGKLASKGMKAWFVE